MARLGGEKFVKPIGRTEEGRPIPAGAYLLAYKCLDCGCTFHVAKRRGPMMHNHLNLTYEEVLLLHTMHDSLLYRRHLHGPSKPGTAKLVGLKPYQNTKFYALTEKEKDDE